MKLIELLTNIEKMDEESVLYVNRIDSEFSSELEVTILNLTEKDINPQLLQTAQIPDVSVCKVNPVYFKVLVSKISS